MNKIINAQQIEELIKVLSEIPAKLSFNAINILLNLPVHEETKTASE